MPICDICLHKQGSDLLRKACPNFNFTNDTIDILKEKYFNNNIVDNCIIGTHNETRRKGSEISNYVAFCNGNYNVFDTYLEPDNIKIIDVEDFGQTVILEVNGEVQEMTSKELILKCDPEYKFSSRTSKLDELVNSIRKQDK